MLQCRRRNIVSAVGIIILILLILTIGMKTNTNVAALPVDYSDVPTESTSSDTLEMELIAYTHSVLTFTKLSIDEVNIKLANNDAFILYVGRATCQWCRKVAPALSYISSNNSLNIFYLDSEDTESNSALKKFRNDHDISTVPAIIVFSNQNSYRLVDIDVTDDIDALKKQLCEALL